MALYIMKQLDLLEGENLCCGTLCDKMVVQARINRMQAAIDQSYEHLCYGGLPLDGIEDLQLELSKLQSTD